MLSVIIPSYNAEQTIAGCLESLRQQSYKGDREIILVDSSSDNTPDQAAACCPGIRVIRFDKKTDPGTARNRGIMAAQGKVLAFIDADCIAAPDWLEKIAAAHRLPYAAIGGSICNHEAAGSSIARAGYIAEFREFLPEYPRREVSHIPTCNISYKREIFERYGMFQGEYYPQEDLLLHHRLHEKGEKILFDPSIKVYHQHRTTLGGFFTHQFRIGESTSRVLSLISSAGSFLPRHPILAPIILPFLPPIKFVRTISVFLRRQPQTILHHPRSLFIFAIGLIFWVAGFAQGIYARRSVAPTPSGQAFTHLNT